MKDRVINLIDSIQSVDSEAFKGKRVLIVDDLYQSGASINAFAMKLQEVGAKELVAISCEKTCRNTDNE